MENHNHPGGIFQTVTVPLTDLGRKRRNNEDWCAYYEPSDPQDYRSSGNLYIVADGVGGASKGERASQYAAQRVLFEYYQHPEIPIVNRLVRAMKMAGNEIYQYSAENALGGMATTMVAAVIHNSMLTVANVGDSRAYLIRGGRIAQISRDHNMAAELVRNGTITQEEAKVSKVRNKLTRSLGGEENVDVDLFEEIPLQIGDLILLCTDGLTRYANEVDILRLCEHSSPAQIAANLVDFANGSGGADNITLIVCAIQEAGTLEANNPHGNKPTNTDWDTIQTQSAFPRVRRPAKGTPDREKVISYGLLGLIIIAILFVSAGLFRLIKGDASRGGQGTEQSGNYESTITLAAEDSPILDTIMTVTPTTTFTIDPNPDDSGILNFTPSPSSLPGLVTNTFTPTLTQTWTELPTITPDNGTCIHRVLFGQNLSQILMLYDQDYGGGQFFYFAKCETEFRTCQGPEIPIQNNNSIDPVTTPFIKIPNVNQSTCEGHGVWVYITE